MSHFCFKSRDVSADIKSRTKYEVRNTDANILQYYQNEMNKAPDLDRMEKLDAVYGQLHNPEQGNMLQQYTSADGKTLILDKLFHAKYDLYRDLKQEQDSAFIDLKRDGLAPQSAIRFTDQAMLGWKQSIGDRNPSDVGLERVVHKGIVTDDTVHLLEKVSDEFENEDNLPLRFFKGEEEFERIAGTIHVQRVAEMLFE